MKLKALLLCIGLGLASSGFAADNRHYHPSERDAPKTSETAPVKVTVKAMSPDFCEIEVINNSYENVLVYGRFEDGAELAPFPIYFGEYPHYINMFYYGYCHGYIDLNIDSFNRYRMFRGRVFVGESIPAVPYLMNKTSAQDKAH